MTRILNIMMYSIRHEGLVRQIMKLELQDLGAAASGRHLRSLRYAACRYKTLDLRCQRKTKVNGKPSCLRGIWILSSALTAWVSQV